MLLLVLSVIPTDGRRAVLRAERAEAEKEAQEKESREAAEAEAREAAEDARRAAQLAAQLDAEAKKLAAEESRASALAAKAQAKAEAAAASVDGLASKAKELGIDSFTKTLSKLNPAKGGQKKDKTEKELVSAATGESEQKSPQSFFGGLFRQQEAIFVDDD